jgi:hypothetical protein
MAFNYRLDRVFPGMGQPLRNDGVFVQTGLALSGTTQQTFPIPSSGVLSPTTSAGRIRVKIYNGAAGTLTDLVVTATDGTNTIEIGQSLLHPFVAVALSATAWLEFFFDYLFDVSGVIGGGGGASGQLLSSIGGANAFSVKTTLGAGTASMDLELAPLV